jgi:ferritin-like protein
VTTFNALRRSLALPGDVVAVRGLGGLSHLGVQAERCAIRTYTDICNYTAGKDHRTYDLALAILNEEVEHEAWFSEFLGEGPSGHFRRGALGDSPYVRRFMTAGS